MSGKNCWDIAACGRGPNGGKVRSSTVCAAATARDAHGFNNGDNGGRGCWAVVGTFAGGSVCEAFKEHKSCLSCPVLKQTRAEEGDSFRLLRPGQQYVAPQRGTG